MGSSSGFSRVTVVGLGLMGGSLSLAVEQFYGDELDVAGVDYSRQLERALSRRAVDRGFKPEDLEKGVKDSDLVVLATPVSEILELIDRIPSYLNEDAVVLDLGSTKRRICTKAEEKFPSSGPFFLGGHPMAGAETSGMEGAHPLLYENAIFALVEVGKIPSPVLSSARTFLENIGAQPILMNAERHDRTVARISHLPQLVSVALTNSVGRGEEADSFLSLAGGGLRDMTRIAASPYRMWEDILDTNEGPIEEEVEVFIEKLEKLRTAVKRDEVDEHFREANEIREKMPAGGKGLTSRTFKIAVMVPDRPGALAEVTACLAEEGLNIKNLELQKVREDYRGTFHLYFAAREDAERAASALEEEGFDTRVMD